MLGYLIKAFLQSMQIDVSLTSSFHLQQAWKTADNQPQSSLIGNV